jgi:uncharacterized protein YkwD
MGAVGAMGSTGQDESNFYTRIKRYGTTEGLLGENIVMGKFTAEDIVMDMLIDDGNAFRRNRSDMLSPSFRYTGIANCEHASPLYGNMVVIVYAGGYEISDAGQNEVNILVSNN